MAKYTQITFFGLSVWLMLSCLGVSADNSLTAPSAVEYKGYEFPTDPEGRMYHRFLRVHPPEGLYYNTRQKASANIDDTPEKETIVLMTADTGVDGPRGEWVQAFLLIAEDAPQAALAKKKDLFKLFDSRTYDLDVPGKTVELRNPAFVFENLWRGHPWGYYGISFELVDLTGDGILDVWVDYAYGVAVISFQNGEFKEVCSGYSSPRRESPVEYIDIDSDGIYEIKIPSRIHIDHGPMATSPQWISLYAWDGTAYALNNAKFYSRDDSILIQLLSKFNGELLHERDMVKYSPQLIQRGVYTDYFELCKFYIGLAFYYRGELPLAQGYLEQVVAEAKNEDYRRGAASILKQMSSQNAN